MPEESLAKFLVRRIYFVPKIVGRRFVLDEVVDVRDSPQTFRSSPANNSTNATLASINRGSHNRHI